MAGAAPCCCEGDSRVPHLVGAGLEHSLVLVPMLHQRRKSPSANSMALAQARDGDAVTLRQPQRQVLAVERSLRVLQDRGRLAS